MYSSSSGDLCLFVMIRGARSQFSAVSRTQDNGLQKVTVSRTWRRISRSLNRMISNGVIGIRNIAGIVARARRSQLFVDVI